LYYSQDGDEVTLQCSKCHTENPSDSRFCKECGADIKAQEDLITLQTQTYQVPKKDLLPGTIIDEKYKLIEELGKGGMGIVYKVEQIQPFKRTTALKIIKLGMDTQQVVARFETERQALAVMDHPNIAKVYDAGSTDTGRPYFAMELVHGIPITKYCDKHKLTTKERLELFISVCQAVQHAHQKGVIHRDLKPSNILVAIQEDKPVPKIIDFGIAKATEHKLTEKTLFTEHGQLIGTPEYMSPEQAEMSGLDVDTRTDIYSLGIILYELLVGVLPFDPREIRSATSADIQRIIREVDPPKISTRLNGLGDTGIEVAAQRRTDVSTLHRELKGDLDWITMRAMAKDRTHRYSSASELGADIKRHLQHEPITAARPSASYRIKKYIRRHRVGVAAAIVISLALLIGISGTSIGLLKATKAEKRAKEEAQTAETVTEFLVNLFNVSDPGEARGNSITAREILEKGAERIEKELSDQPLIQSRIMETIGQVYQNLGLYSLAEPLLKRTLDVRRNAAGEKHYYTGVSMVNLAWFYLSQRRMEDAEPLVREGVGILENASLKDQWALARGLTMLGMIHRDRGEFDLSQEQLMKALSICEHTEGSTHLRTATPLYHLGWLFKLRGEYEKAEEFYERAYAIMERELGSDHPNTLWCLNDMAVVAQDRGDYPRSKELYENVLETAINVLGEDHPFLGATLNNLGILHWKMGEYAAAESCTIRSIDIREKSFGRDHPYIAGTLNNLALIYIDIGAYEEARRSLKRAESINLKTSGPDGIGRAETLHNLAVLDYYTRQYESAEKQFARALEMAENILGSDHPDMADLLSDYAHMLRHAGKYTTAESIYKRILEIKERQSGTESLGAAFATIGLAGLYAAQKDFEKADSHYQRFLDLYEIIGRPDEAGGSFAQAVFWAISKDQVKALQFLKRSLELGFKRSFFNNPDFAFLGENEEFIALCTESKKNFPSSLN